MFRPCEISHCPLLRATEAQLRWQSLLWQKGLNFFPHPHPFEISENTTKLRILSNCIQPQSISLFPSCRGHQWMNSIQYLSADLSADLWVNALIKLEPCIKSCIQRCQSAPAGWSETRSWPYHRDVGTRASVAIVTVCQSTGTCN